MSQEKSLPHSTAPDAVFFALLEVSDNFEAEAEAFEQVQHGASQQRMAFDERVLEALDLAFPFGPSRVDAEGVVGRSALGEVEQFLEQNPLPSLLHHAIKTWANKREELLRLRPEGTATSVTPAATAPKGDA